MLKQSLVDSKASARLFFVALVARRVASPHPQSITEGWPREEFMLNKIETAHAVSVVDLVVADWKGTAQGMCLYLQCDVGIISVEISSESVDS